MGGSARHRPCPLQCCEAQTSGAALKQLGAAADRSNAGHDAFEAQAGLCAGSKKGDRWQHGTFLVLFLTIEDVVRTECAGANRCSGQTAVLSLVIEGSGGFGQSSSLAPDIGFKQKSMPCAFRITAVIDLEASSHCDRKEIYALRVDETWLVEGGWRGEHGSHAIMRLGIRQVIHRPSAR